MDRIRDTLLQNLKQTLESIDPEKILENWRPLPEAKKSKAYAIDGSRVARRLSGTIVYFLTACAVGSGRGYSLSYANAMQYNYAVSEQMIRMQMETLENMIGYLSWRALNGRPKLILMDGTLTGSLIRPPIFPDDIRQISILRSLLGEHDFDNLIEEYKELLDEHYKEVEEELEKKGKSDAPIISDNRINYFVKRYITRKIIGHFGNKTKIRIPARLFRIEGVPVSLLEKFLEEGKTLEDLVKEIKEERVEVTVDKDTIEDAFHVLLAYIEYLHSLEKLLHADNLVYVAKTFYTKKLATELGIPIVDTTLLDATLRSVLGEESEGYLEFEEPIKAPRWEFPEYLFRHFKRVKEIAERGVYVAYVRLQEGDVIYMLQSTKKIRDILPLVLSHKSGGYIEPLRIAHNTVKISQREADMALSALINSLRAQEPMLKIFVKYGRMPLE
ncbi:Putative 5' to 3'nuclease, nura homolog [Pyrococcus abyssi GE5]|nr:Putative 5' to 3'nuclease, nura homolog [Pyrococcus abyssi GE5]